jgi:hypothetical protein
VGAESAEDTAASSVGDSSVSSVAKPDLGGLNIELGIESMPRTPWTWTWPASRGARPLSPSPPMAGRPARLGRPHPSLPFLGLIQHGRGVRHSRRDVGGGGGQDLEHRRLPRQPRARSRLTSELSSPSHRPPPSQDTLTGTFSRLLSPHRLSHQSRQRSPCRTLCRWVASRHCSELPHLQAGAALLVL